VLTEKQVIEIEHMEEEYLQKEFINKL
jgi:hypothetical protein